MAQFRNDELGNILKPLFEAKIQKIMRDENLSEPMARAELIRRFSNATIGGSSTTESSGGDKLEISTVRQVLSGRIKNPSLNMLEGIAEALGISVARFRRFAERNQ